MHSISIKLTDYTDTPGARYIFEGPHSGQDYLETVLNHTYLRAIEENRKLLIDIDGCFGYPSSFFNEAFGGLARRHNIEIDSIWDTIELVSSTQGLVARIKEFATDDYLRDRVL